MHRNKHKKSKKCERALTYQNMLKYNQIYAPKLNLSKKHIAF